MSIKSICYGVLGILAAMGGMVAQALGGWDEALRMLCIIMAMDYITGIICALVWKKSPKSSDGSFNSRLSLKGLLRKAGIFLAVLIAYQLDSVAGTEFIRTSAILFFIANDGLSVIENLGIMGLPMPSSIKNAFEILRKKSEETG
ncbi:MAG: phage holin family protein [Oscillospiraceae bacterium]|nr:phage holin family protein [Oscillospiraceae bacterium]MDD3832408.1 phage holin family protein [Oscillospiraceae bacterium]MDD4545992.1 phage holin family protein [Oscillospiraceae bacterium]